MMVRLFRSLVLVTFLLPAGSYADSISCSGGIVSSGDTSAVLFTKCGPPYGKDVRTEEVIDTSGKESTKTVVTIEDWTYNFGPDQFMRIVTVRNGVVTGVRTAQYGAPKDGAPAGPECGNRIISAGDTKSEVLIKCGEPFYKDSHQEELRERIDETSSRKVYVTIEEWTYNYGPQRFMRIITFRNGTVVDIRTGGYGR